MSYLNERTKSVRKQLLKRYYKSAVLEWARPKHTHWAKVVDSNGNWRWTKADKGIRGKLLRDPPIHIYQTVVRFRSEMPPRGYKTRGHYLGGPLFFDIDSSDKESPFSLWRIMECADRVQALAEFLADRGDYRIRRVNFSGFRGIHVLADFADIPEVVILDDDILKNKRLKEIRKERLLIARSLGNWLPDWDWRVSADIWRVARVPRSIHGKSALSAITFTPPYTAKRFRNELIAASPFSPAKKIRIRFTRSVPLFTFIDEESYGPYRKGWATKLPLAVALHLIWQDKAKPREAGPHQAGLWFENGWQTLFRVKGSVDDMGLTSTRAVHQ